MKNYCYIFLALFIFSIFMYINFEETIKTSVLGNKSIFYKEIAISNTLDERLASDPKEIKQILLVSHWRSGSSWLGDLLSKTPNSFYVFEPLHIIRYYWNQSPINLYHGLKVNLVGQLMNCVIPAEFVGHFKRWDRAHEKECLTPKCYTHQNITSNCTNSQFRIIKTVRLYLQEIEELLITPSLKNLKVIYLVRDPRGVINSILHIPREYIGTTTSDVCPRMREDMTAYPILKKLYTDRLYFLRYEDLANNSIEKAEELWHFIHGKEDCPELSPAWVSYLNKSSESKRTITATIGSFATENQTSLNFQVWRQTMSNQDLKTAEDICGDVIDTLGYRRFPTGEAVRNISLSSLSYQNCAEIPCSD